MKKKKFATFVLASSLLVGGSFILASCNNNGETVETCTVEIETDEHGTVTPSATSGNVGDEITLTVTPNEGYELDTLIANGKSIIASKKFTLISGKNIVTAKFKEVSVEVKTGTVVISETTNGTVTASKTSGNVGDEITLTVTPNEGYELDTLTANGVDIKETKKFTLVEGENTVVATFKEVTPEVKTGTVVISETTNGTVTANKTSGNVGDEITLTVTPNEGYELDTLTANGVDIKETKKFTLVEGENTVVATFKALTYEITVTSDKEEYKEGDGAALLEASVTNEATSKATDWNWDTTNLNNIGVVSELPSDHAKYGANARFFTPTTAGSGTIVISCKVGEKTISYTLDLTVTPNYDTYTKISTADDLLELLDKSGTITDKYYLDANIDLGGMEVCGRDNGDGVGLTFNGVLDGRGHTISNFTAKNTSSYENDQCAGLFYMFGGTLRNIHIQGNIDTNGFSGLLAKEVSGPNALVENCLFEANDIRETIPTDWTWQRNGVISSVIQTGGTFRNCVTSLTKTNDRTLAFAAYGWNAEQTIENCYTNITSDSLYKPFNPEGGAINSTFTITGVDFATATTSTYSLDTSIWTLADNTIPHLAHYGEKAVTISPSVALTSTVATELDLNASKNISSDVVDVTVKNATLASVPTYEIIVGDSSIIEASQVSGENKINVTAKEVGTTTLKVKVTIDGEKYVSNEITYTVKDSSTEAAPTVLTVLSKGSSATRFEGAGCFIWLSSEELGMTGANLSEFSATVEAIVLDSSGNPVAWTPKFVDFEQINETNKYVAAYVSFPGAPVLGYKTTINLTITHGDSKFTASASFTASTYDDPNGSSEEPSEPTSYTDVAVLETAGSNTTKIDGVGIWLWVKPSDLGMDATNYTNYSIVSVDLTALDASGNTVAWTVNDKFFSDYNFTEDYCRIYIVLSGAPVEGYKTTLEVKISNGSDTGYKVTASFTGLTLDK